MDDGYVFFKVGADPITVVCESEGYPLLWYVLAESTHKQNTFQLSSCSSSDLALINLKVLFLFIINIQYIGVRRNSEYFLFRNDLYVGSTDGEKLTDVENESTGSEASITVILKSFCHCPN